MSDDVTKDVEIALRLLLGKRMEEALSSNNIEEAKGWAAKLKEAEDLVATMSSQNAVQRNAQVRKATALRGKSANGEWIN